MGNKMKNYVLGGAMILGLFTMAEVALIEVDKIERRECVYEINYPDGFGGTITRLSNSYAESYFIQGVHQNKYYFIPLEETDTLFFVGDNQTWSMQRLSCE